MRVFFMVLVSLLSNFSNAEPIATALFADGNVITTHQKGTSSTLRQYSTLAEGDHISTGQNAHVSLMFQDGTVVDLQQNSSFFIRHYRPQFSQDELPVFFELDRGHLRMVTGTSAKKPGAFRLRTPHSNIEVQGTEFEVALVSDGETQIKRHAGTVLVSSLEFQGQMIKLTESAPIASITLNQPAKTISTLSFTELGPLPASLYSKSPNVPRIVTLAADGGMATGRDGTESLEPIATLISLVDARDWQNARLVANELQPRFEGTPRFDLYNGLILMAENNVDEAIFAFERVLIHSPNQLRARFELGRAYFAAGNNRRAQEALNEVLSSNPPKQVASHIKTLLAQIKKAEAKAKGSTFFSTTVLAGWDSNANSGSNLDGELAPNLLGLTRLNSASESISSGFVQWSVTTGLIKPTNHYTNSYFVMDFTNKNLINTHLADSSALTFSASINGQSDHWRSQLPVSAQWSWLEGHSWQSSFSLSASQQYKAWGVLWVGVKIGTQIAIALDEANETSVKDMAGLIFDAQEHGRNHSFSSFYLQTTQAGIDDDYLEWQGLENKYQVTWAMPKRTQTGFIASHQWRYYSGDDLFFTVNRTSTELKRRQDQIMTLGLRFAWAPTVNIQTQSGLNWEWQDSNINAYGLERFSVSQALSVKF